MRTLTHLSLFLFRCLPTSKLPLWLVEGADPSRFDLLEADGWQLEHLPLEELFIELVRSS